MVVLLSQLAEAFGNPQVAIAIAESTSVQDTFAGVPMLESFFYLAVYTSSNPIARAIRSTYVLLSTTAWAAAYRFLGVRLNWVVSGRLRQLLEEYVQSDLVVACGGGYIIGGPGLRNAVTVLIQLHSIFIGDILGKPTILYSQSYGPFYGSLQPAAVRVVLNRTRGVMCREGVSMDTLANIGVRPELLIKTVDAAFLYSPGTDGAMRKELADAGCLQEGKSTVGITVRAWLDRAKQDRFEQEMARFVAHLAERDDVTVVFIPQSTSKLHGDDDREVAERVRSLLLSEHNVVLLNKIYDCAEIRGIYGNLDYMVGTRMHSNIFSLAARVPVIAIQYLHKTSGIMADLELGDWVVGIEDVTSAHMAAMFARLVAGRDQYLSVLDRTLPRYIESARSVAATLGRLVGSSSRGRAV